jgi:quercetin dioxygenase-like cupin family protein
VFASGATGAHRLSTGTASFRPGAELPYHTHPVSEAITVLNGSAEILVEGRCYRLNPYDAMHIPSGVAHAVRNPMSDTRAVLHSAFACDTPTRDFVSKDFRVTDRMESDAACPEHLTRFDPAPVYELSARAYFRDLFARRLGSRGIAAATGCSNRARRCPAISTTSTSP